MRYLILSLLISGCCSCPELDKRHYELEIEQSKVGVLNTAMVAWQHKADSLQAVLDSL